MRGAILSITILLICTTLVGQKISERKIRYGFLLGANYSNVIYQTLPTNGQVRNGTGTQIGIISDIPFNRTISFAPKVELAFNRGEVRINQGPDNELIQEVMPVTINLAGHMRLQKYHERYSPYFFAGPSFRFAINENSNATNLFPSRNDLSVDIGVGINRALSFLDIAPALRYSYGIFNVNQNPALGDIRLHSLALTLSFLG